METRGPRVIDVRQFRPPNIRAGAVTGIIVVLVILWLLFSTIYTVGADEVGVVQRFGAYVRQTEPGLRFKLPYPIETVSKVAVQRQAKEEFGFRTAMAGVRTRYSERSYDEEALMLTGDLNVAVVEWETQYRINEPYNYRFKVRNVIETFRDLNEAVMREVVGDRSVDEVLTVGRQELASEAGRRLQELCDQYQTGIQVVKVLLQDVTPPDPVKPSFNEVNQAQQEKEKTINQARGEYNRVIPKARGQALQTVEQAEGYATDRVNRAKGDAARFNALLAAYRRAPEVTRRRIYLETLEALYPKVKRKIVLDSQLKGVIPLLDLQKEAKR